MLIRKKNILNEESSRLLRACLVSALVLSIPFAMLPVSFATNDDGIAQLVMAGIIAPEPSAYVPFMGMVIPWVASKLFILAPGIAWWPIIHIVTLWVSITLVCWTADLVMAIRWPGLSDMTRLCCLTLALFAFFTPFVVRLQFTTTGTIAAVAGMFAALVLNDGRYKNDSGVFASTALPLFLVVVGAGYRLLCAQLGLLFWVVSVIVLIISTPGKGAIDRIRCHAQHIKVTVFAAILVFLLTVCCSCFLSSIDGWSSSGELSIAQAQYTDYPDTPYQDDPDVYESVGWDEDLARLSRSWYQMDSRQTAEAYQTINEQNTAPFDTFMQDPLGAIKSRSSQIAVWVPMTFMCLQVVLLSLVLFRCEQQKACIGASIASVLFLVLMAYLIIRGRVNERAMYSALIPCISSLVSILFIKGGMPAGDDRRNREKGYAKAWRVSCYLVIALELFVLLWLAQGGFVRVVAAATGLFTVSCAISDLGSKRAHCLNAALGLVVFLSLIPGTVKQMGWSSGDHADIHGRQVATEALFDYCEENPDEFYIYDLTGYFVPTDLFTVRWPKNQTNWGGWKNAYFWYGEALKRDGYSGIPTSEWFLHTDVRFVCGYEPNAQLLLHYLRGLYGENIEMVYEKTLADKLVVYRFECKP